MRKLGLVEVLVPASPKPKLSKDTSISSRSFCALSPILGGVRELLWREVMGAIFGGGRGVGYTFRWMFCVQNFWWRRYCDDGMFGCRKRCRCASHWYAARKFVDRGFSSFPMCFWFLMRWFQITPLLFQFQRGGGGCWRNGRGRLIGACAHLLLFLWRIGRWTSTR